MKIKQCEWCPDPARWWLRKGDYVRYSCRLHIRQTANLIRLDLGCEVLYMLGSVNPVTGVEEV